MTNKSLSQLIEQSKAIVEKMSPDEKAEMLRKQGEGWAKSCVTDRCPTCNSSAPHMHPAIQHEGEVEICTDDFHLIKTNQNSQQYIDAVLEKRKLQRMEVRK